jgi:hypothetical protein
VISDERRSGVEGPNDVVRRPRKAAIGEDTCRLVIGSI